MDALLGRKPEPWSALQRLGRTKRDNLVLALHLELLLQDSGQVHAHEARSLGHGRAQGYLDAPLWAVILAALNAGPHPGADANEVLDEAMHGRIVILTQQCFLCGGVHKL